MGFVDYYDVLQVSQHADADVIEKAYRVLMSKHHPDAGGDTRHAQRLNEAHDVIGNPNKRADYDRDWARHQNRTVPASRTPASAGATGPQGAPRSGRRHPPLAAVVVGLVLTLLGIASMATGSALLGLLLAALGLTLLFNLWGLWLLVALLTLGAGIVLRHGLRVRRQARAAKT
jgi:curved DNA-binding protein CbpA